MRKHLILTLLLSFMTLLVSVAQEKSYQLSSHILYIQNGRPAPGVRIALSRLVPQQGWVEVEERTTDDNGRVRDFLEQRDKKGAPGTYKLTYYVGPYSRPSHRIRSTPSSRWYSKSRTETTTTFPSPSRPTVTPPTGVTDGARKNSKERAS